tara:strand:+ start:2505 stop:3173 length:669 start_codon:yes stop_codon:yes gene_type:complete
MDINNKKNLILITSIVNTIHSPLSYTKTRSVFTRYERFEQTKNTIFSIQKYIPNYKILLVECSHFSQDENEFFYNNCDYVINLVNDLNSIKYINSPAKAAGEGTMTKKALEFIINNDIKFDNLFKITGRYNINDKFNYNIYNNDLNIFKKIDHISLYTSLYKIKYNDIKNLLIFINNSFSRMINAEGYEIIFNDLSKLIDIEYTDNLGVTGFVAVSGIKVIC